MVKARCGELVNRVLYACQQFYGGFGYIRESAIERMARDARIQFTNGALLKRKGALGQAEHRLVILRPHEVDNENRVILFRVRWAAPPAE